MQAIGERSYLDDFFSLLEHLQTVVTAVRTFIVVHVDLKVIGAIDVQVEMFLNVLFSPIFKTEIAQH